MRFEGGSGGTSSAGDLAALAMLEVFGVSLVVWLVYRAAIVIGSIGTDIKSFCLIESEAECCRSRMPLIC